MSKRAYYIEITDEDKEYLQQLSKSELHRPKLLTEPEYFSKSRSCARCHDRKGALYSREYSAPLR